MNDRLPHQRPSKSLAAEAVCHADSLKQLVEIVLVGCGINEQRSRRAAQLLLESDLRGIDSHGVARLWVYVQWLEQGHANADPDIHISRETASTLAIHGDGGLGIVVGPEAHDLVLAKAEEAGSAWGVVSHSNHFGIAGYYALQAAKRKMIGMVFSNATAQVFPVGSVTPMLGTNPIAIAFPAGKHRPVVIDMATSTGAFGKIEMAMRKNQPIPSGWVTDRAGKPITNPQRVFDQPHSLSPLGATEDHAVHKGYCLASAADLMSGVLSGAAWGPHCPHFFFPEKPYSQQTERGLGHAFSAMRVDAFDDLKDYEQRIDEWIDTFRSAPPSDHDRPVKVPGDPEWECRDERERLGIPLTKIVFDQLSELGKRFGFVLESC